MSFSSYAQVVTNTDFGLSVTDNNGTTWYYEVTSPYSTGGNFAYVMESTSLTTSFIGGGAFFDSAPGTLLPSGFSASVVAVVVGEGYVTNYVNYNGSAASPQNPLIGGNAFGGCSNITTINIASIPTTIAHPEVVFVPNNFSDLQTNNSCTVTESSYAGTIYYTIYNFFYNQAKGTGYGDTLNYIPGGPPVPYPCFMEGTKIQTKYGYVAIENLRKGDLVKTLRNGFVPVNMIGYRVLKNSICQERIKDKLYKYTSAEHSEIFEDLVITGCHSILVDDFKAGQRDQTEKVLGDVYVTDNKYRLPACVDSDAKPYEVEGNVTIWHVALDNDDYFMNYGIYANGLLVESTSKRYLKEISGMTLVTESLNISECEHEHVYNEKKHFHINNKIVC